MFDAENGDGKTAARHTSRTRTAIKRERVRRTFPQRATQYKLCNHTMFRLFGTTIGGESGSGKDGDGGEAKPTTTAATQRPRPGLDANGTRRSATANNKGAGGDKGGFFKLEPARGARGETTLCVVPLGVPSDTKPLGVARYICTTVV